MIKVRLHVLVSTTEQNLGDFRFRRRAKNQKVFAGGE